MSAETIPAQPVSSSALLGVLAWVKKREDDARRRQRHNKRDGNKEMEKFELGIINFAVAVKQELKRRMAETSCSSTVEQGTHNALVAGSTPAARTATPNEPSSATCGKEAPDVR